jgi:hypothetical protein
MDPKGRAHKVNFKNVAVKLRDGTILNGKVNIYPKERISDVFMSKEKIFVIIVEGGSYERDYQTIVVNKKEVVWVEPEEPPADEL